MSNKKTNFFNGKGYYIALALCAIAIGVSGYLYYANANDKPSDSQPGQEDVAVAATDTPEGKEDLPVAFTQPNTEPSQPNTATQPSGTAGKQPLKTASPVDGQVVAVYAMDSLSYNSTTRDWRVHNGVDIAADEGTKVCAAADGTVYTVYEDDTMGMTVVIRHEGGYVTKYSSLAENVTVKAGDTVKLGQQIGCVGETALLENAIGCHVHFSVTQNDTPVDPSEFLSLG